MTAFHSILVPVDFSEPSRRALRSAVALAADLGARVTLLNVVRTPQVTSAEIGMGVPPGPLLVVTEDEIAEVVARQLDLMARSEVPAEADASIRVRRGFPAEEIVREAAEGGYDLVVMGTHGHTGVARVLLGSVAERVVRHSEVPVLVHR